MKITKTILQRIIKEEITKLLSEGWATQAEKAFDEKGNELHMFWDWDHPANIEICEDGKTAKGPKDNRCFAWSRPGEWQNVGGQMRNPFELEGTTPQRADGFWYNKKRTYNEMGWTEDSIKKAIARNMAGWKKGDPEPADWVKQKENEIYSGWSEYAGYKSAEGEEPAAEDDDEMADGRYDDLFIRNGKPIKWRDMYNKVTKEYGLRTMKGRWWNQRLPKNSGAMKMCAVTDGPNHCTKSRRMKRSHPIRQSFRTWWTHPDRKRVARKKPVAPTTNKAPDEKKRAPVKAPERGGSEDTKRHFARVNQLGAKDPDIKQFQAILNDSQPSVDLAQSVLQHDPKKLQKFRNLIAKGVIRYSKAWIGKTGAGASTRKALKLPSSPAPAIEN